MEKEAQDIFSKITKLFEDFECKYNDKDATLEIDLVISKLITARIIFHCMKEGGDRSVDEHVKNYIKFLRISCKEYIKKCC